mmetsp:Transcript_32006/g.72099  ORF Transcript_32006/g.72099 Transcript_32006/m.72099 type:complete len:237 (+) Transcript_32006:2201-2911(+)
MRRNQGAPDAHRQKRVGRIQFQCCLKCLDCFSRILDVEKGLTELLESVVLLRGIVGTCDKLREATPVGHLVPSVFEVDGCFGAHGQTQVRLVAHLPNTIQHLESSVGIAFSHQELGLAHKDCHLVRRAAESVARGPHTILCLRQPLERHQSAHRLDLNCRRVRRERNRAARLTTTVQALPCFIQLLECGFGVGLRAQESGPGEVVGRQAPDTKIKTQGVVERLLSEPFVAAAVQGH